MLCKSDFFVVIFCVIIRDILNEFFVCYWLGVVVRFWWVYFVSEVYNNFVNYV